eukprot:1157922-Pelagomonas_calceolata.AAC.23
MGPFDFPSHWRFDPLALIPIAFLVLSLYYCARATGVILARGQGNAEERGQCKKGSGDHIHHHVVIQMCERPLGVQRQCAEATLKASGSQTASLSGHHIQSHTFSAASGAVFHSGGSVLQCLRTEACAAISSGGSVCSANAWRHVQRLAVAVLCSAYALRRVQRLAVAAVFCSSR